jgi:D-psicose/D-tagatose/L-ribulose 3-epimerase
MNRRAVSNLAWPDDAPDDVLEVVAALGFDGVEIAPAKAFGAWDAATPERLRRYREEAQSCGLEIPALQGIMFGTAGCALFVDDDARARLRAHLERIAAIAETLGARSCVYGAPLTRDPGTLSPEDAWRIAVEFFGSIGPLFHARGCTIAIEANPARYKCRFVTTTAEAVALVRQIDHPGIRVHIDTGTIFINGESPDVIDAAVPLAAHCHASEQDFAALGATGADHRPLAAALRRSGYSKWISAEIRHGDDWRRGLAQTAEHMARVYG